VHHADKSSGLRAILNEWDLIGVADEVNDEYDCLIPPLLGRLRAGATRAEIFAYLSQEVRNHFGLRPRRGEIDSIAERLVTWWAELTEAPN
jgi:hypothetical protein